MNHHNWHMETLSRLQEEYLLKNSDFMNRIIDFQKSIFLYYKKHKSKNYHFKNHSFIYYFNDIISLYELKKFLQNHNYEKYINEYLTNNQEWYSNTFIPKNKDKKIIEIVMGNAPNKVINGQLCGYGFKMPNRDGVTYGWSLWVKRWRFLKNDQDRELENIDLTRFKKGLRNK